MSSLGSIVQVRIGRKPAPGRLALVQAFLNTTNLRTGREDFKSPEYLAQWLAEAGLLPAGVQLNADDVRHAVSVRNALFRLIESRQRGDTDAAAVEALNRSSRSAQMSVAFNADGSARIEPLAPSVDGALGKIIAIVVDAMADGTWQRLKMCVSDDCSWAFYDRSKNRSGHWCNIADCGNVAKARAYRARHAQAQDAKN
jgi:predicted RNA-binding Zn ribbon-like protein